MRLRNMALATLRVLFAAIIILPGAACAGAKTPTPGSTVQPSPTAQTIAATDAPVRQYLEAQPPVRDYLQDLTALLERWLPHFAQDDRSYVTVGIGCTGGRHRSVYLAERLSEYFRERHTQVLVFHRELE